MPDFGPHSEPHPDVAGYLLGGLDADESRRFADHLDQCGACREELTELAGVPGFLADVPPSVALPPGLEERTFAAIEAAARAGADTGPADRARPSPAGDGSAGGPSAPVIPISQGAKRRRRPPLLLVAAAVAVAVGLAVGVTASVGHHSSRPALTIRLVSVGGGPAHGVATVRSTPAGLTIDMTVNDLPPSPPASFYTCWLVGPGDTLHHPNRVSVGSFVVAGAGPVHVHWTTAADLHRFPQLGVTLEPNNGNPAHQGPKVLTGTIVA
jgi:hypothetical protein